MIKTLCLIGVGLIGGSLAKGLRAAGRCGEIVGCDRDEGELKKALELGVIDRFEVDPATAVKGADMVVVAVPVGAMREVFNAIAPSLAKQTVITDVGSTKVSVKLDAESAFGALPRNLVPGHPIAGTERSGVGAANADLFRGRLVMLTPVDETSPEAIAQVKAMWEQVGAEVRSIDIHDHDRLLAATSHLPHVLAYTLVNSLAQLDRPEAIFEQDELRILTRIASSDPRMWTDICLANREAILNMLMLFSGELAELAKAIDRGDRNHLSTVFGEAKGLRERFESTAEAQLPGEGALGAAGQLSYILAFTLVHTLGKMGEPEVVLQFAAGGFRDFTRIAASDPSAWAELCLVNRKSILNALADFSSELSTVAGAIGNEQREQLMDTFSRAKALRDRHAGH